MDTFCCGAGAIPGTCGGAIRLRFRAFFRTGGAAQEIQRQETAGYARYLDGWLRRLRQQFNPMRFYLTPEGLAFFYPMYAIAPAAEGIPVFTVPYEAVGPYVPVSEAEPSSSAPQT